MGYKKIIIFALAVCLIIPINSFINPEIKKAVRKSHPDKLENLLSQHKLTEGEKATLLIQAKDISKLCLERAGRDDLHLKKKRSANIKLFLTSVAGLTCAMCGPIGIYGALTAKNNEEVINSLVGGIVLGAIGAVLIKYDLNLYKKLCKTRNSKQKYMDATEVEHILNRIN